MNNVTLYHNPQCSKSRQTLTLLQEKAIEPKIQHYLDSPPSVSELYGILALLDIPAKQLMRTKEPIYQTLNLADETNEAKLIQAMHDHPILIERPIVIANSKAAIGRPPEAVLALFD